VDFMLNFRSFNRYEKSELFNVFSPITAIISNSNKIKLETPGLIQFRAGVTKLFNDQNQKTKLQIEKSFITKPQYFSQFEVSFLTLVVTILILKVKW
jgi:hypothetical protein